MIKERIKTLNNKKINDKKGYYVYWMQSSQRVEFNLALNYTIKLANKNNSDLIVAFVLTEFPHANLRHYEFMIQGLKEVKEKLKNMNIRFVLLKGDPVETIITLCNKSNLLVTDRGYLKNLIKWREDISKRIEIPMIQVEDNVLIPVELVSDKEEYSAATFRRKYNKILSDFNEKILDYEYKGKYIEDDFNEIDINNYLDFLEIDKSVKTVNFEGGHDKGIKILEDFLVNKLEKYSEKRNDPSCDYQSNISPYLHFGMISPLEIYELLKDYSDEKRKDFFEQVFVRRELARNFCFYNKNYDNFNCITGWARETLKKHEKDKRKYVYSYEELEMAKTHDEYWNATQMEMIKTGKMHGYMRMYWAKKVIEWTQSVDTAYKYLVELNNKYELDGRDENGYTGIAWSFGKHDRPWKEREIFGKVRYMNSNGLKRKFDIDKYVQKINKLE